MANKPHHQTRQYVVDARLVRHHANANPASICWRCRQTLDQHPPHLTGRPATWHAGHTITATPGPPWLHTTQPPPPGPWLAAEASTCNIRDGSALANPSDKTEKLTGYTWGN